MLASKQIVSNICYTMLNYFHSISNIRPEDCTLWSTCVFQTCSCDFTYLFGLDLLLLQVHICCCKASDTAKNICQMKIADFNVVCILGYA